MLLTDDLFDQPGEPGHVANFERAATALDQAGAGKLVQLARHRFTMRADAARDVAVCRGRRDDGGIVIANVIARQTQPLSTG